MLLPGLSIAFKSSQFPKQVVYPKKDQKFHFMLMSARLYSIPARM